MRPLTFPVFDFILKFFEGLHYEDVFSLSLELLLLGGWFFIFWHLWPQIKDEWINWRQDNFWRDNPDVLMEVTVPQNNTRNIRAIEQVFAQIHGLRRSHTWWETWWKGQYVLKVSLEIVSFEGYIKYFVRSTYKHRHLVEAALRSQYPDIEITSLTPEKDFVHVFPDKIPDKEFDMLGTEYVMAKPHFFPMKTYKEYEQGEKVHLLDPHRHLLEMMSSLKQGEYMWYQLILVPEDETWGMKYKKEVSKMVGEHIPQEKKSKSMFEIAKDQTWGIIKYILFLPVSLLREVYRQLFHGTAKIAASQLKGAAAEVPRQVKGMGKEAAAQLYCLHEAFLSQFRKKKTKPTKEEAEALNVTVENYLASEPNITFNAEGTRFPSEYLFLSDKKKRVIDAIERKLSKQVYKVCVRSLYFAKKPVFSKFRFWSELHGAFRHYNDIDYNVWSRGKYSKTTVDYMFAKIRKRMRQNAILKNAKSRDWMAGDEWNYLCTEEIATLWHLPHKRDLLANIYKTKDSAKPPPSPFRVNPGYQKENLIDFQIGQIPDNLPIPDFEPLNFP